MDQDSGIIVERLDLLLRLTAMQLTAGLKFTEAAVLLERAGIERRIIAEILGSTPESVRAVISKTRKARSGKHEGNKLGADTNGAELAQNEEIR